MTPIKTDRTKTEANREGTKDRTEEEGLLSEFRGLIMLFAFDRCHLW
jgi:hypothetical protein